ncbi:MAG: ABC transporter substrate-binding protein [Cyanobacteria bacterium P01_E01_bin.34]
MGLTRMAGDDMDRRDITTARESTTVENTEFFDALTDPPPLLSDRLPGKDTPNMSTPEKHPKTQGARMYHSTNGTSRFTLGRVLSPVNFSSSSRFSTSRRRFLAFCGGVGFVVAGCGSPSHRQNSTSTQDNAAPIAPSDRRISVGITDRIRTLDPSDAFEPVSLNVLLNVGETLYTYDVDTNMLVPLLANDLPAISPDGTTYTIPVRQGVTFHDGTPFNAEAMAFSLQRSIENGGKPAFLLSDVVESVAASSAFELVIQLKEPFSAFTSTLAFPGACAVSPTAHTIGTFEPETVVATGHYRLVDYAENSRLVLDRNDDYWGEPAANSGIDIQSFNTPASLLNAFKSRTIDIAFQTLEPSQIQTLVNEQDTQQWQVASQTSALIRYLVLNVTQPPLDRLEVRQAIAAAINRTLLQERVFLNQASPLFSLVPDTVSASIPAFKDEYGDRDLDRAIALLKEAGFTPEAPAQTTLWHASSNARGELIANTLKASLEADLEGLFQLELQSVEAATLFSNLDKGSYPMVLLSWAPDFLDPDNYLQPFVVCDRSEGGVCTEGSTYAHGSFFDDNTINQLVQAQRQEADTNARTRMLEEVQVEIAKQVPFIPLVQGVDYAFGVPKISGLSIGASQSIQFWVVQSGDAPT